MHSYAHVPAQRKTPSGSYKYNTLTQQMDQQVTPSAPPLPPPPPSTTSTLRSYSPLTIEIAPLIKDPLLTPADAHLGLHAAELQPLPPVSHPRSILQKKQPPPTPQRTVKFSGEQSPTAQQRQLQKRRAVPIDSGDESDRAPEPTDQASQVARFSSSSNNRSNTFAPTPNAYRKPNQTHAFFTARDS